MTTTNQPEPSPPSSSQPSGGPTDSRTFIERYANVLIAVIGLMTALIGYLGVSKSNVVEQRNDVQTQASTLTTEQSQLRARVTALTAENADLHQQLEAASSDPGPKPDTPHR